MNSKSPRLLVCFIAIISICVLCALIASRPVSANREAPVAAVPPEQSFVRRINLLANDVIVDPTTQMLYASVPSRAGSNGNSITPINGSTGVVGTPVFIGSEPGRMAISDNGQYIYALLNAAASIRRFNVTFQTPGLQFSLGLDSRGTIVTPRGIEVQPGNPGTVAIGGSDSSFGLSIFVCDDGIKRGSPLGNLSSDLSLSFKTTDPSRLFGLSSSGLTRMSITPGGPVVVSTTNVSGGGLVKFDDGRLYTSSGSVLDPDTGALIGTFTGTNLNSTTQFVSDSSVKRIYYLTSPFVNETETTTLTLRVFDEQTFTAAGTLDIPNVLGQPNRIVRWGSNGLAFTTTGGQLYTVQTTLIPSADPVPTPTPIPSPTPTPTPIPTPQPGELTLVTLVTRDLVVDPITQFMYASIPSSVGAGGNSILQINPVNGTTGPSVFVGSEPNKLAVSDGGEALYVGLDGAGAIRRVDLSNLMPGIQFSLGVDQFTGPNRAFDIAVAPGQPEVVAVSRMVNSIFSRNFRGVAIYDNGVQRPMVIPDSLDMEEIEFSTSPQVLYGQNTNNSEAGFRRVAVGSCGAVALTTTVGLGISEFKVDNGIAFSFFGGVADPETPFPLGRFSLIRPDNAFTIFPLAVPEVKAGRVYFLVIEDGLTWLRVYNTKTFLKIGELQIPGVTGTPSSLVRFGAHGIAFRTSDGQVWLLQNNLIGGQDPQFMPSSAPPTPTAKTNVQVTSFFDDPSGVTITTSGSLASTGITDATGKITINGVPPCGGLTVTPSKTNYTFFPASITTSTPVNASLSFSANLRTLGFNVNSINVSESVGKVVIAVSRNTSSTEPASVSFETISNTASDRSDFNRTLGTLHFAPSDSSKQITLLITNDSLAEGPESFTVKLSDISGAALKPATSSLTVNIVDDDSSAGPTPLGSSQFFVRQHYQDFLNRAASDDPSGLAFWTNEIDVCNSEADPAKKANCLAVKRINVSAAFFLSIEFQQTGYLVHRLYTASFPPGVARPRGLPRFSEFLRDIQDIGQGIVVGAVGWEQKLEQNKQAFVMNWVMRPEFLAEHPETQPASSFVDSLFLNAGSAPTTNERAVAIAAFGSGDTAGRAAALRSVVESQSVSEHQFNSAFVLMQYFGYLRRNPDDAPDGDFNGYDFWLTKLNQFNGNFIEAEMVKAFLLSSEYQQRFGPANFVLEQ